MHIIGHGRYARETYPKPLPPAATPAQLAALVAILDNNVQLVGPTSASADTIWLDSALYTLVPSTSPIGNATVDVKASISVTGAPGDSVVFSLVRDRTTNAAPDYGGQLLTSQEATIPTGGILTVTLAYLDTNVGTWPPGFVPLTEQSTHTYSIVATDSSHALTGTDDALIYMDQLPSGATAFIATPIPPAPPVALHSLLNFAAFAGTGISTTGATSIEGSIGLGPGVTSTAFTGFGQTLPAGAPAFSQYATSSIVVASAEATAAPYNVTGAGGYVSPPANQGVLYASDYAVPTPANVNTSYNDLLAAYTAASGLPAGVIAAGADIGGTTLDTATAQVYRFTGATSVGAISGPLTLHGTAPHDSIVIQIAGTFDIQNNIVLTGTLAGHPENVFFAVAGQIAVSGTAGTINGEFLGKTGMSMTAGWTLNGRALPQTGLTLIGNTIVEA